MGLHFVKERSHKVTDTHASPILPARSESAQSADRLATQARDLLFASAASQLMLTDMGTGAL